MCEYVGRSSTLLLMSSSSPSSPSSSSPELLMHRQRSNQDSVAEEFLQQGQQPGYQVIYLKRVEQKGRFFKKNWENQTLLIAFKAIFIMYSYVSHFLAQLLFLFHLCCNSSSSRSLGSSSSSSRRLIPTLRHPPPPPPSTFLTPPPPPPPPPRSSSCLARPFQSLPSWSGKCW